LAERSTVTACRSNRPVDDARIALHHLILLADIDQSFGRAENQIAAGAQRGVNTAQDVRFALAGKIDQHIATEDDIEAAEGEVTVEQIQRLETHALGDVALDAPALVADRIEMAAQALFREPPPQRELVIFAGLAGIEHLPRQIGGDDLDRPPQHTHVGGAIFLDRHAYRVRLLPR